jgi:2-iminobutanoate/2-iminopropanoate deaminase
MSVGLIVAVSPKGVIGVDGTLPWHYSADHRRFKRLTLGTTVIMGRLTWESLPKRPLVGRRNVVITSRNLEGVECFPTIREALASSEGDVWFIGGARIYEEAMRHADFLDVTLVPDAIDEPGAIYFPEIDETVWEPGPLEVDSEDPRLKRRIYRRRRKNRQEETLIPSESPRHEPVTAPALPKALGPYSPGVQLGELIFVSGQGAVDPKTGKLAGEDVESQTQQVFENIRAILEAAGSGLHKIVRCGVFLADMRDFPKMNAVYERMLAGNRPARTTVQAGALPMAGLLVEIDAIAYR